MPRKKIAEQEPVVPMEGAAAGVVKAAAKKASAKKARAPRASANAVTHKHKKNAIVPTVEESAPDLHHGASVRSGKAGPTGEDVAKLAYSYWESRGYRDGSPTEDWLRAERELGLR